MQKFKDFLVTQFIRNKNIYLLFVLLFLVFSCLYFFFILFYPDFVMRYESTVDVLLYLVSSLLILVLVHSLLLEWIVDDETLKKIIKENKNEEN